MNAAIWARVTVPCGSYVVGVTPWVTSYHAMQSIAVSASPPSGPVSVMPSSGASAHADAMSRADTWAASAVPLVPTTAASDTATDVAAAMIDCLLRTFDS